MPLSRVTVGSSLPLLSATEMSHSSTSPAKTSSTVTSPRLSYCPRTSRWVRLSRESRTGTTPNARTATAVARHQAPASLSSSRGRPVVDPFAGSARMWLVTCGPMRATRIDAGMADRNHEAPARQDRAGARLGISAIAAHSLCPSLGIANLASDAGFDNGCRYVAKLKQICRECGRGRAHEFEYDSRLPTAIRLRAGDGRPVGRYASILLRSSLAFTRTERTGSRSRNSRPCRRLYFCLPGGTATGSDAAVAASSPSIVAVTTTVRTTPASFVLTLYSAFLAPGMSTPSACQR